MRQDLDDQLDRLLADVITMGERADAMLAAALAALAVADAAAAARVVADDAVVDQLYERVQQGVLTLVALHGPVGHDLRVATAMLHASLHVERMADYATSVANVVVRTDGLAPDATLRDQVVGMGGAARAVGQAAMTSLAHADEAAARAVARLDDDVDRLDVGIFGRLVELAAADGALLPWASRMIGAARCIERYADHAVDVAEQVVFIATGRTVELSSSEE
jgi:phosphate transport system protein